MLNATRYEHIALDDANLPLIEGTTMKVVELVLEKIAYGWSPEELQFQQPYLTLGQIYSALAYYADHRDELDRDIERRLRFAEESRFASPSSPLRDRLRTQGLR